MGKLLKVFMNLAAFVVDEVVAIAQGVFYRRFTLFGAD